MMKTNTRSSRRGVAIIIVLGLMAILMIMAVAFSIQMRVERAGAATYRHGIVARHIIWAGLANAIDDIDSNMDRNRDSNSDFDVYPSWSMLHSSGDVPKQAASVVSKDAVEYLPGFMKSQASSKTPYWHIIKDQNGLIRGRYAFMVANMSGLLDANRIGGDDRGAGTNVYEIQLDELGDIGPVVADFLADCTNDVRYETLPELRVCNTAAAQVVSSGGDLTNFATFSLAKCGEYFNRSSNSMLKQAFIGGPFSAWDDESTISNALMNAKVYDRRIITVYDNMRDYADADSSPQDLNAPCGESVPMINEFETIMTATRSGDQIGLTWVHNAEWFYPFIEGTGLPYRIEFTVRITPTNLNPVGIYSNMEYTVISNFNVQAGYGFAAISNILPSINVPATNTVNLSFWVTHSAKIFNSATIDVVDSVPFGPNIFYSNTNLNGSPPPVMRWMECIDPRFNWSPNSLVTGEVLRQWWTGGWGGSQLSILGPTNYIYGSANGTSSIGAQNHFLTAALAPGAQTWREGRNFFPDGSVLQLYVANKPFSTVGELGHIAMGPWESIRLVSRNFANVAALGGSEYQIQRVFDYFTCTNIAYERGLVNLNTRNREVLASVFLDAPEFEFSNGCPFRVDIAEGDMLVDAILDTSPYTNYWDMQAVLTNSIAFNWTNVIDHPESDIALESVFRNSMGLLTLRHNLFTVFVRADSFSEALGGYDASENRTGMTLASAKAVAEIWRDPYRDTNGNHRCLIRMFRYIED